ncbi:hypothetical protein D9M71_727350 [compost metagenome]
MLGIPCHDVAFREALANSHPSRALSREWSHPAIRHAALQCELRNLADLPAEKASVVFDRAYDITIRRLMKGEPLGEIAVGIGHDSQKTEVQHALEHGDRRLQKVMARQGISTDGRAARAQLLARFGLRKSTQLEGYSNG